ncbi:endopolygalacturonase [Firmicutes bacterium CAG:882]|nr:endopolygalacturonase [Firmicutes bacterium CAG:882]
MESVKQATGCTITARQLEKNKKEYDVRDYGAGSEEPPAANTAAINRAIEEASVNGGTVVFPEGEYKTYTIRLKSNVNIRMEKGAVIRAARSEINTAYEVCEGEGGNYDEPEVCLYAGLQDHGHTYFANSLIYGKNLNNIMIYGDGLIDGSYKDEYGYTRYALLGGDPANNKYRNEKGHDGAWYGNKGIALVDCKNVVLKDFSIVDAGHFAIICEGVENMLVDGILVDTIRDAFDVDCCRDVTVVHSRFNSLTDDALVMKASFGAGKFMPLYNVYIEDCEVTGYDAGSVYSGKYTCDKVVATDRCGPTARVKLGTESTCGYELVTVKNVRFKRSRGFALEAVDTSDLTDIVFTDCTMENVSSSPIYIRIGDRGRFPVTGSSTEELLRAENNVRLDNTEWVLPNREEYGCYPVKRYTPSYNYTHKVTVDGHSYFNIVDEKNPVKINPANFYEKDGKCYEYVYNSAEKKYEPDFSKEISKDRLCLYANAVGREQMASVRNIEISNVRVKDADPRYPIIIMGLDSSHVKNVSIKNIEVEYRGGLLMEHAVEQRQLNTNWEYSQLGSKPSTQILPWLVNTFFLKNEGLLPRMSWNKDKKCFVPAPYNVPELAGVYPEPSNWGILPAYGIYARHVDGLELENIKLGYIVEDERPAVVFDDVHDGILKECGLMAEKNSPHIVFVENKYKRPTNLEYVPDYPYHTTDNSVTVIPGADRENYRVEKVCVDAPAPGTPRDTLYSYPTAAVMENTQESYTYEVKTEEYELPATVHRPYFVPVDDIHVSTGRLVCFDVMVRNPLTDGNDSDAEQFMWEGRADKEYVVECESGTILMQAENLPYGADFDTLSGNFIWTPEKEGEYHITFTADDGVIPISMQVNIIVEDE